MKFTFEEGWAVKDFAAGNGVANSNIGVAKLLHATIGTGIGSLG